jgi:hypothetical protein
LKQTQSTSRQKAVHLIAFPPMFLNMVAKTAVIDIQSLAMKSSIALEELYNVHLQVPPKEKKKSIRVQPRSYIQTTMRNPPSLK